MILDHLSIVELNERGRAISRLTGRFRRIRPNSQGIGGGCSQPGRHLLEELTVVSYGPLIDGATWEIYTSTLRFLTRTALPGRL